MQWHITEFVTGLIGVAFIGAAFIHSLQRIRNEKAVGRREHPRVGSEHQPV